MGLNDRHFTNPDRSQGESLEEHQRDVGFRQQLAGAFHVIGPHNVRMETGHVLLPLTHSESWGPPGVHGGEDTDGPQVIVSHRNDPYNMFSLPLGHDSAQWMPNLARHLNSRPVMERMREQMNGPYGDE